MRVLLLQLQQLGQALIWSRSATAQSCAFYGGRMRLFSSPWSRYAGFSRGRLWGFPRRAASLSLCCSLHLLQLGGACGGNRTGEGNTMQPRRPLPTTGMKSVDQPRNALANDWTKGAVQCCTYCAESFGASISVALNYRLLVEVFGREAG